MNPRIRPMKNGKWSCALWLRVAGATWIPLVTGVAATPHNAYWCWRLLSRLQETH